MGTLKESCHMTSSEGHYAPGLDWGGVEEFPTPKLQQNAQQVIQSDHFIP